jgi:hypothetical protein
MEDSMSTPNFTPPAAPTLDEMNAVQKAYGVPRNPMVDRERVNQWQRLSPAVRACYRFGDRAPSGRELAMAIAGEERALASAPPVGWEA